MLAAWALVLAARALEVLAARAMEEMAAPFAAHGKRAQTGWAAKGATR